MTTPHLLGPDDDAVHEWFELTYATHLVLERTLMQSMPGWWQRQFVDLLRDMDRAFPQIETPEYKVLSGQWEYRMCRCEEDEEGWKVLDPQCGCEALGRHVEAGSEFKVFVEGPNPVPHYQRGRTRIEPIGLKEDAR